MERAHRSKLTEKFGKHLSGKRVICLEIPDDYGYMDPAPVDILKLKVPRYLPAV